MEYGQTNHRDLLTLPRQNLTLFLIRTQNIWTKFLVCEVKPVYVPSSTRSVIYVFKVVHMQTVTITHVRQIICFELDFFTFI